MCTRFIKLRRQEGRNSHVTEDHIGVCYMKKNVNKKASEHMNFHDHTRNVVISTDKSSFRGRRTTSVTARSRSPPHISDLSVRGT
jgi:hypothetical protein